MLPNGRLNLEFSSKGKGITYLSRQFYKLPLQVLPVNYPDNDGTAFLYLLNPSSGMMDGDLFDISLRMTNGAKAVITTPSSNKIYKTPNSMACQQVKVSVEPHCILEYLPEHNVPYANSSYRQTVHYDVEKEGMLFTWDILEPGRMTRGEVLGFDLYQSENIFYYDGQLQLIERARLCPQTQDYTSIGILANRLVSASCYLVCEKIETALKESVAESLTLKNVIAGVSCPNRHIMAIKVLTAEIDQMQEVLHSVWHQVRVYTQNKPAMRFRKY